MKPSVEKKPEKVGGRVFLSHYFCSYSSGLLSPFQLTFLPNKEYPIYFNTCLLVSFGLITSAQLKDKKCINNLGTLGG